MALDVCSEAERRRRVPGVYFADEPSGRTAKLAGTGLGVWEVITACRERPLDRACLARCFDWLSPAQIRAVADCYAAFPDEIDAEIAENDAITPESLYRKYPFMRPR